MMRRWNEPLGEGNTTSQVKKIKNIHKCMTLGQLAKQINMLLWMWELRSRPSSLTLWMHLYK